MYTAHINKQVTVFSIKYIYSNLFTLTLIDLCADLHKNKHK